MRWPWCFLALLPLGALAAPAALHRGSLTLTPCAVGTPATALGTVPAFCTRLEVPERRTGSPAQRRIALHVAVLPATGTPTSPDPIVFLAGGPGQAATAAYPALAPVFDLWRRHRDVVVMDQRGTGESHPLSCSGESDESMTADVRAQTQACLKTLSAQADVAAYTTTETVADLADLQGALGLSSWNLVGVSYGTRVAQRFALAHPDRTRSLVLDSAVPADANLAADTGPNLDRALRARFKACVDTPACSEAFGDPAITLRDLRTRLGAHAQTVAYRAPDTDDPRTGKLTARRLEDTVRLAAYAPETAALLAHSLSRARHGDAAALMALGDMAESELAAVSGNVLQLSVLCTEDPPMGAASAAERASLLGTRSRDVLTAQCAIWPRGEVPEGFHTPRAITAPTLVLQGEWDPATPPDYGRRVAQTLTHGHYLLAKGQGHNVVLRGCLPKLVNDFLDAPAKPVDAACLERLAPLPDVLDANGAAP